MLARLRSALGSLYRRISGAEMPGEDLREKVDRLIAQSSALDLAAARDLAEALLADDEKFLCSVMPPAEAEVALLSQLGPELRRLLTRYAEIEGVYADFRISRAAMAPAPAALGMWSLGEDGDHTQILVRPNDDRIYIADESGAIDDYTEHYASIYHYIALLGALVYDVDLPVRPEVRTRTA